MDSKYDMINLTQYIVFLTNFKSLENPVTLASIVNYVIVLQYL